MLRTGRRRYSRAGLYPQFNFMKQKAKQPLVKAVDLFAGAGGMSLGAHLAGISVHVAVENDPHAAKTYSKNHTNTKLLNSDIREITPDKSWPTSGTRILFGGPPCQGYSTSNQVTRSGKNPANWLFREFFRIAKEWNPTILILENVKGILETDSKRFIDRILVEFQINGYHATGVRPPIHVKTRHSRFARNKVALGILHCRFCMHRAS